MEALQQRIDELSSEKLGAEAALKEMTGERALGQESSCVFSTTLILFVSW